MGVIEMVNVQMSDDLHELLKLLLVPGDESIDDVIIRLVIKSLYSNPNLRGIRMTEKARDILMRGACKGEYV
jgi:hypothetical protein